MDDLISRVDALEALNGINGTAELDKAFEAIEALPSAQPEERKKGEWIVYKAPNKYHCGLCKCSFCGYGMVAESDGYNYCPKCGADMRGEQDE